VTAPPETAERRISPGRLWCFRGVLVFLWIVALAPVVLGVYGLLLIGPWYDREARAIERIAAEIPGVEVIEVDGNHDITLEDIWLDIRYRGEAVHFGNVTSDSFDEWTPNLGVMRVGDWWFSEHTYPDPGREAAGDWNSHGGALDLEPGSVLGELFDPPLGGIRDFLERFDEVKSVIATIPIGSPGIRTVDPDGTIHRLRRKLER
jgi:hypothetical protein